MIYNASVPTQLPIYYVLLLYIIHIYAITNFRFHVNANITQHKPLMDIYVLIYIATQKHWQTGYFAQQISQDKIMLVDKTLADWSNLLKVSTAKALCHTVIRNLLEITDPSVEFLNFRCGSTRINLQHLSTYTHTHMINT